MSKDKEFNRLHGKAVKTGKAVEKEVKKGADDAFRVAEGAAHKVEEKAPGWWQSWKDLVGERRAIPVAAVVSIVLLGAILTMCKG